MRKGKKHKKHLFRGDKKLASIAKAHSIDMAKNHYFSHINLRGESLRERALKRGIKGYIGENICKLSIHNYNNLEEIAKDVVKIWMKDQNNRDLILNEKYFKEGIGAAISSDGKIYVTQVLG